MNKKYPYIEVRSAVEQTENRYYEHNKRRELFKIVNDLDLYGRVVIRNTLGREFAVDQGVSDKLYTAVDETEAAPLFQE